jgi:hypothetical protein
MSRDAHQIVRLRFICAAGDGLGGCGKRKASVESKPLG